MDKSELDFILYIKNLDVVKPLYKLLVLVKLGYDRSEQLKDIFGGNYVVLLRDGALNGLLLYEKGRKPELTGKGRAIADIVHECIEKLRQSRL